MKRFWFEFEKEELPEYSSLRAGCGVTASGYDDAIYLLMTKVFDWKEMPAIKNVISDVDVSALDQRHVVPNMKSPHERGVWFPLGHD